MRYEQVLAQIVGNYDILLKALLGRYLQATMPGSVVTPLALKELKKDNIATVQTFSRGLSADVQTFINSLTEGLDEASTATVNSFRERYEPQIVALLYDNVSTLIQAMRESKGDMAKMMNGAHGALGQVVLNRIQNPQFKARDDAGRNWDAEKLFKFLMRNWLYSAEVRADIEEILAAGEDLAMISYDDPAHKNYGLVFSISGNTPGYPSLASIQASVFHFNATAEVVHVSA